MLTSATISHYKSINDATLHFNRLNVIVGPNGSGKSNIMDAIYFIRDCAVDDIDTAVTKRHGIDSLRQWSRTKPYNIIIDLRYENPGGVGNYRVVLSSVKGQYRIIEEQGQWYGEAPFSRHTGEEAARKYFSTFKRAENGNVDITSNVPDVRPDRIKQIDPQELLLTLIGNRSLSIDLTPFRMLSQEIMSFSKYNIYPNTLRNPQLISRETTLREDGSNLSSVLKHINSNKRYVQNKEDIVSSLQALMPAVVDIQIKSAAGYYVPVLRVSENDGVGAHDFNLSQISDGTLRTLGLLTAFYQPSAPGKIGIEEPEQMIHPGALSILFEAMESFINNSNRIHRQIFVTTHSPTLIDLFNPDDIIWAKFKKGVTECGHINKRQLDVIKQHLFSAGELLIAEGLQ